MPYFPRRANPRLGLDNQDNQRASVNSDTQALRTLPANSLGEASFFGSNHIHTIAENSKALVFGALGVPLTTDLTVTTGHKHDTQQGRLRWRQLATNIFVNSSGTSDDIEDAIRLATAGSNFRTYAVVKLWIPLEESKHIVPRFRLSVAAAPSADCLCNLRLEFYSLAGALYTTVDPLAISTVAAIDRKWFEGSPINLSGATVDADFSTRVPLWVEISKTAGAATESLYLHELSWGVYDL